MQFLLFLTLLPLAGVSLILVLFTLLMITTLLVEFPFIILILGLAGLSVAFSRTISSLIRHIHNRKRWMGAPCV